MRTGDRYKTLGRFATIMQSEMAGIVATAQLSMIS